MSTHPNVILLLVLKPDGLARKTYRAILDDAGAASGDADIKIGDYDYHHAVMEDSYHEDWQISADEGDTIVFDLLTYGYGERIAWSELVSRKVVLEEWATGICERHKCTASIFVTANYW